MVFMLLSLELMKPYFVSYDTDLPIWGKYLKLEPFCALVFIEIMLKTGSLATTDFGEVDIMLYDL